MDDGENALPVRECPACGEQLRNVHCNYACPNCGYSVDYSDL